ncbi:hypothetical protein EJ02DRAFT_433163 [Clathrospora elynae]|uniref:Uncharacterized protein n=1 Tax=Clathrospora elynae TaxID=706981 RepID=A0A6A5SRW7_9PLEO|nr:hypothetical protein EJ02DRAFT_433163 [Clathrospora elynae]
MRKRGVQLKKCEAPVRVEGPDLAPSWSRSSPGSLSAFGPQTPRSNISSSDIKIKYDTEDDALSASPNSVPELRPSSEVSPTPDSATDSPDHEEDFSSPASTKFVVVKKEEYSEPAMKLPESSQGEELYAATATASLRKRTRATSRKNEPSCKQMRMTNVQNLEYRR